MFISGDNGAQFTEYSGGDILIGFKVTPTHSMGSVGIRFDYIKCTIPSWADVGY